MSIPNKTLNVKYNKLQAHIFTPIGNITSCTIKTHPLGGFQHGHF